MTSLFTHLRGKQPCFPTSSNLAYEGRQLPRRERNRLKKEPPPEIFISSEEPLETIHCQSYLTWRPNQSNVTVVYSGHLGSQSTATLPPSMKLQRDGESTSLNSQDGLMPEELRRTRAKTPVLRIGQLERKPRSTEQFHEDMDPAIVLAQQYQALLPSREATPFTEFVAPITRRHGLRRIKCQDSLRALVHTEPNALEFDHFGSPDANFGDFSQDLPPRNYKTSTCFGAEVLSDSPRPLPSRSVRGSFDSHVSTHSSDSETLLGSDSELSPHSPMSRCFSNSDLNALKLIQDSDIYADLMDLTMPGTDIGMQLTMDLLTNDLTTALHHQNSLESGSRASGLQILLMIEAYESLQQKLRRDQAHVTQQDEGHMSDVMDHWLHALRSIYERSISRSERAPHDGVDG